MEAFPRMLVFKEAVAACVENHETVYQVHLLLNEGNSIAIGEWWRHDLPERYWLEITKRPDFGANLNAPTSRRWGGVLELLPDSSLCASSWDILCEDLNILLVWPATYDLISPEAVVDPALES